MISPALSSISIRFRGNGFPKWNQQPSTQTTTRSRVHLFWTGFDHPFQIARPSFSRLGKEVREAHPRYKPASDMEDSAAARAQPQVVGLNQANLQGRRAPVEFLQQSRFEGYEA